jgi:hypothetical protein
MDSQNILIIDQQKSIFCSDEDRGGALLHKGTVLF